MIKELQLFFDLAIRAYLPPLSDSNPTPIIGIAFANSSYPKQVEKILKATSGTFKIEISASCELLNLRVIKSITSEHLFDVSLNYEVREFELFKNQVKNGNKGAFVVGSVHEGYYHIVSENISSFKPFQVESFYFI